MNIQNIRKKRKNSLPLMLLLLSLFQFSCNVGKRIPHDRRQHANKTITYGDTAAYYDTVFYSFPQLEITNTAIYEILDLIIGEKDNKILKSDVVPFYGSIYLKCNKLNDSLSFLLTNMQSSLYENELFLKGISGVFNYRGIFFFAISDSNCREPNGHIRILRTKMKAFALKLMDNNRQVLYPAVVFQKGYVLEDNKFLLKSAYLDRIRPGFRTGQ